MKPDEALKAHCVADTCFLSNFIFPGQGLLMRLLVGQPVNITSSILDPLEPGGHDFLLAEPFSELLRPLYFAQKRNDDKYRSAELPLQQFLSGQGHLWSPVTLTEEELRLAISFATPDIWLKHPQFSARSRGLGAGECEALAVAMSRGWTLLTDDQAALDLASCIAPNLSFIRTCRFLILAVDRGLIRCNDAGRLFNEEICGRWGFYAKKSGTKEHLRLRCDPPDCCWEGIAVAS